MKKTILLTLSLLMLGLLQAQVGINTVNPLVSLHVDAFKTDATTPEGIIAPRLTRAQLTAKDAHYTILHEGTFVYVTTIDGTASAKTVNVITVGYYYFDGAIWKHFNDKLQTADNGLSVTTSAKVQLGGDLIQNTKIETKGHNLTVTGLGKVGIGTATPNVKLDIETGGTTTAPIAGFKLRDGYEGFGKVLTDDDGSGTGVWKEAGVSYAISGNIPSTENKVAGISVPTAGVIGYTGMNIVLPKGNYQVNFTVWAAPDGDFQPGYFNDRFAAVFFSDSPTSMSSVTFSYLSPIKSILIPRINSPVDVTLENSINLAYYGSGAIPVEVPNNTIIYVWVFMSNPNYKGVNRLIRSSNGVPGIFGPYTQLYAIPFHLK